MKLTARLDRLTLALIVSAVWIGTATAQPLVTGNLTIYYDFDEIASNQFLDESGNGFDGTISEGIVGDTTPGTLTLGAGIRGAGSADFNQSVTGDPDLPVYVDAGGKNITDNFPGLLPTSGVNGGNGYSIAAWLNVGDNDGPGDQSVWQTRAGNGVFSTHFQLQRNGKLRMTIRSDTETIVNERRFTDGTDGATGTGPSFPINDWFHFAGTYDATSNAWAIYFNGEQIADGFGAGTTGNSLADWGGQEVAEGDLFAAGFGAVEDSGERRLDGLMDEFYVYNRGLSATEVAILASVGTADYNGNGIVDAADYTVWRDGDSPDSSQDGYDLWKANFGNVTGSGAGSGAGLAPVPEPSTAFLGLIAAILIFSFCRPRRALKLPAGK